jgi:hypothetical protein
MLVKMRGIERKYSENKRYIINVKSNRMETHAVACHCHMW